MSERVDVLAVLDMALLYVEETHEIHPGDFKPGVGKKNTNDIKKARAAVAELIEADLAYDAANLAVQSFDAYGLDPDGVDKAYDHLCTLAERAANRRAAALARVSPP